MLRNHACVEMILSDVRTVLMVLMSSDLRWLASDLSGLTSDLSVLTSDLSGLTSDTRFSDKLAL